MVFVYDIGRVEPKEVRRPACPAIFDHDFNALSNLRPVNTTLPWSAPSSLDASVLVEHWRANSSQAEAIPHGPPVPQSSLSS